jgi:hypothetical protein
MGSARGEEHAVARLSPDSGSKPRTFRIGDVLPHRPRDLAVGADQRVGQPAGAAGLGPVLPAVELAAGLGRAAWHHHRAHVRRLEHPERGAREVGGQVGQLKVEAQVRLVRSEPGHRVGVGHPRQRGRDLVADDLPPQRPDDGLAHRDHVVAGHERHLEVDLGELRLPVLARVLVAEAPGQLVVALEPADHEQLLEQLRRLRQRVPVAGAEPDRDDEIARALRRRPGQIGRLHVDEAVVAHHV